MTKLEGTIKREIRVHGIEQPIQLTIDPEEGLSFNVKGSRKHVTIDWVRLVKACRTGVDVPSYLAQSPFELLQHLANKIVEKKEKE
jgi:hypothetical protein